MLDQLYQQPSTCLAIFKLLKPLSKQIVVRLLYGTGITKPQFDNWFYNPKDADAQEHLNLLWKLNICVENEIVLNKIFQLGLHYALTGSGTQSFGVLIEAEDAMTVAELDRYAQDQWQGVLYSLVGNPSKQRPHSIVELLQRSGLMVPVGRKSEDPDLKITSKGFQFLLQQTSIQIWAFLLHYLEMAEQLDMNVVQVLGFIFQLANLELGKAYSVEALDPSHRMMLEDLKHLGLIYQRKKKSNYFYPTRLSTSLTADTTSVNASGKGYILVETNYRIYAYTNSPFQIAILGLFVSMKTRFPNMVVGLLNRDSVKEAFDNGITADQIISYLTSHAHPQMLQSTPILPSTVVDQIRLWEMERNRLKASPGYLYMNFDNRQQYTDLLKYSTDFGYCLWSSDQKMMLFVSKEGHEPIKQYYSSQNKK
ncbi:transcription factor Tfb2-domain-containing protein [Gorgonomyces haynaldii]|nr:transcription factor Tfb2-domain-containing protein [Gorgonomyces haynaldii]